MVKPVNVSSNVQQFGRYRWVSHVIDKSNLSVFITDDGEGQWTTRDLSNVVDPSIMSLDRIGREAD